MSKFFSFLSEISDILSPYKNTDKPIIKILSRTLLLIWGLKTTQVNRTQMKPTHLICKYAMKGLLKPIFHMLRLLSLLVLPRKRQIWMLQIERKQTNTSSWMCLYILRQLNCTNSFSIFLFSTSFFCTSQMHTNRTITFISAFEHMAKYIFDISAGIPTVRHFYPPFRIWCHGAFSLCFPSRFEPIYVTFRERDHVFLL